MKRILVVTVEEAFGELFAAMLSTAGYECEVVCSHEEIHDALNETTKCDLIFCQVAALEKEEKFLDSILGAGSDVSVIATAGRTPGHLPKFVVERCEFLQMPFEKDQMVALTRKTIENCTGKD